MLTLYLFRDYIVIEKEYLNEYHKRLIKEIALKKCYLRIEEGRTLITIKGEHKELYKFVELLSEEINLYCK